MPAHPKLVLAVFSWPNARANGALGGPFHENVSVLPAVTETGNGPGAVPAPTPFTWRRAWLLFGWPVPDTQ